MGSFEQCHKLVSGSPGRARSVTVLTAIHLGLENQSRDSSTRRGSRTSCLKSGGRSGKLAVKGCQTSESALQSSLLFMI